MGLKDTAAKNYFGRPDVLASILDYILYDGRQVVQAEQLNDLCGEHPRILQIEDGSYRTDCRYRDKLFEYNNGKETVSIGVEYQARKDYGMSPRIMDYDSRRYKHLFKQGKMHRIINIVLHFYKSLKKSPSSLLEMFNTSKSVVDRHFFNYGFTSLNIYEMAENYDKFSCEELQHVLYLFKCDREKRPFMEDLENGTLKGVMSRDAALVCAVFLGLKLEIEDNSEEIDMCKAVSDFRRKCMDEGKRLGIDEGKRLGIDEGKRLGIERGRMQAIREIVESLFNQNYGVREICKLISVPFETVQESALSLQN